MTQFLRIWTPVLLWAVLISVFSTDDFSSVNTSSYVDPVIHWMFPSAPIEVGGYVNLMVRKLAHLTEYFVFAWLLARGFKSSSNAGLRSRWVLWTLLIVGFYASTDELHQLYVSSRTASARDVLLDFLGGCCAVLMMEFRSKNVAQDSGN
jgi:VanZ family protein